MFNEITQEDVLAAIKYADKNGGLKDKRYGLWWHNKIYPPKDIIAIIYDLKNQPIQKRSFNTDIAQKRLLELGFPIVEIHNSFFSEKDLISFSTLVNRPNYDSSNPVDNNIGKFLNQVVWEKTRIWANKIKKKGWTVKGAKHWNEQDIKGQRFKKYTWYKIYPENKRSDLLFFTVGVHDDGSLLYKLDIQAVDQFFTEERKNWFYKIRDSKGAGWQTIPYGELPENWESLIEKSNAFFGSQLATYDEIEAWLWADKRLMRLTWNKNNWEFPSVHQWKQKNQGNSNIAYENQYGYGHEEWLFNKRYTFDGYQYGYLRGVDHMSEKDRFIDEVVLYTINDDTKERSIVASIKSIEIIAGYDKELKKFLPLYKKYEEDMMNELKEVNADYKHFKKDHLLPNVKFHWEDVIIYNNPIQSEFLESNKYNRFQPYKIDSELQELIQNDVIISTSLVFQPGKASTIKGYEKNVTGGKSIIRRSHSEITDDLYDYLLKINNYSTDQLSAELTKVGGAIVDLAVKENEGLIIFEAKTCAVGLLNIRQALGQLFEYAFLDGKSKIKKLVIVGPSGLKSYESEYFNRLKSLLQIPLEYWEYSSKETDLKKKFLQY